MKIFSGTSNPPLAKKIAANLGVSLGKVEIQRFACSEVRVRVLEEVLGEEVFVIQSLASPVDENIFELLLLVDSLKRRGAKKIVAIIPYLGYCRQDRVYQKGEAVSISVLAKIIEAVGISKIITIDAHSQKALSYFKIPVVNLSPVAVFAQKIRGKNFFVVSPDFGGVKRAKRLAEFFEAPVYFIEKKRDFKTGKIKSFGLKSLNNTNANDRSNLCENWAIVVDDIITSGQTLAKAAKILREKGVVKIWAFASHADFVDKTREVLKSCPLEKIFITDTIRIEKEKRLANLEILTVSGLISKEIFKLKW